MSKPYKAQGSRTRFFVPMTLAADFTNFLDNDIPNQVEDFILLTDWFDQFEYYYKERKIRGELYPDATKSRYHNTDNNMNIRFDVASGVKKGDMIIDPDGVVFLLDWTIAKESNNAPSRALRCNMKMTVKRNVEDEVDDKGFLIYEGGVKTIVDGLPCNAYRYDGRPEFSAVSNNPGVVPNALTLMTVQYNSQTKEMKVGDWFEWGNELYEIIDIGYEGMTPDGNSGCLALQTRKKAGGILGPNREDRPAYRDY